VRIFNYLFWILIVLVGVSFAAINSSSVNIHYYVGHTDIYLPLLLLIVLVLGAILGMIAMLPQSLKAKSAARKLRSKLKQMETELDAAKGSSQEGLQ